MLILTNQQIETLLSLEEIVVAVEQAMLSYESQTSLVPRRMHLDNGANTLLCMPSLNQQFFATKLVSVVPGNAAQNLPVTIGVMLLNDTATGLPLALMNASKLTALRTGAVGAVGIKHLTPSDSSSIGIIGCGVQGMHQAIFACHVRPIRVIYCLKRNEESFQNLEAFVHQFFPYVSIIPCESAEILLANTNIIIAATTSAVPVLPNDPNLLEGKHFISVGSYKPSMQELPDAVYQLAGKLVIDSNFARHEVGDIINPIQKGILKEDEVFTIGKLLTGAKTIDVNSTTAYKSAGMALYDLFVGQAMYQKAITNHIGTVVEL